MSKPLGINDPIVSSGDGMNELSAVVDGQRIRFRAPDSCPLEMRGELFIGIALLEAMYRNVPIEVDECIPISSKLMATLPEIQSIYSCWNPDLHQIQVNGNEDSQGVEHTAVGSFFSGGVDSSHALYRHMEEISHLIMLTGFDVGNDEESISRRFEAQSAFARSVGKELIPITTNARQWADARGIGWGFFHGLLLCSVSSMVRCKRVYIPSSHTYAELFPWGTHPLTDPMWGTEATEIVHEGAGFRRGDKVKDLCKDQRLLDNLQVCWRSITQNCGECPKCVRVMVALHLLNATSQALPPLEDYRQLKALKRMDESGETFVDDAMSLAREVGDQRIYRILRRYRIRYQMGNAIRTIDRNLLGGILRKIRWQIRRPPWLNQRIRLQSADH